MSAVINDRPVISSMKQLVFVITFIVTTVNLLQTIGFKLVADSYIDSRIHTHNVDPAAHAGIVAAKAEVESHQSEQRAMFQAINEKLDATNQRLARIEGALGNLRGMK